MLVNKEYKVSFPDGSTQIQQVSENCLNVATTKPEPILGYRESFPQPVMSRIPINQFNTVVTNNVEMLQAFGCLPCYTPNKPNYLTPLIRSNVLDYAKLTLGQSTTGERWELGPFPEHVAEYCFGNKVALSHILAYGDVAGLYGYHIYDETGKYITVDSDPKMWMSPQGYATWTVKFDCSSMKIKPQLDHFPNLGVAPLLLTGSDYHMDNLKHAANFCLFFNYPPYRNGGPTTGSLLKGVQIRATAWGVRTLAMAAAYLPDADPTKAYFKSKLLNTLNDLDAFANASVGDFDWITRVGDGTIAFFELAYFAWSLHHAIRLLGISNGTAYLKKICDFQMHFYNDIKWRNSMCAYRLPVYDMVAKKFLPTYEDMWKKAVADGTVIPNGPEPDSLSMRTDFSIIICDIAHDMGFDLNAAEAAAWLRTKRKVLRYRYDFNYTSKSKISNTIICESENAGKNTVVPVVFNSSMKEPKVRLVDANGGNPVKFEYLGKIREGIYFGRLIGKLTQGTHQIVEDIPLTLEQRVDRCERNIASVANKTGVVLE